MPRRSRPQLTSRQKQSTWIILIAIVLMAGSTYWIVNRNYVSPKEEFKAPSFANKNIEMFAFYKDSQKAFIPKAEHLSNELVFKVSTTFPAFIALYEVNLQGKMSIIFSGTRVPPGKERKVEREESLFVYSLKKNLNAREVCLLAADTAEQLNILLAKVHQNTLPPNQGQCIKLI